ncbi:MAG: MBL fold metallo-hydrolase [Candidatus Peribacteraceae bacterium]|nr:MBL fold metallo-hydrolase [Candidatus Peribacteraceae bacterium]
MKLISHGAAREVTGTCHEIIINTKDGEKHLLLDCGLFQGSRKEAAEKNAGFTFDPRTRIDAMILTHAHMDHSGRIPLLYKKGYAGPIYCTYATQDLTEVMLADSAYIQEKDEEFASKHFRDSMLPSGPLYTQKDAAECMKLFVGKNYGEAFQVFPGVTCRFLEAGHILGAAMLYFEIEEDGKKIKFGFSGDLGRSSLPIIRDPEPMPPVDFLICESTYGDRLHDDITTAKFKLKEEILKVSARGGKLLIPAFSLERTQEIVYDLHLLWDAKEIPAIPIIIDSPLASRVTEIFRKHPECYDQLMYDQFLSRAHNPFQFSLVNYTESVEESKELNHTRGPIIIMAGSGMCEAGRIRHHLHNELEDPRNMVLAVGFMAENTLGRRIVDPAIHEVKIFEDIIQKKAEIQYINAYSGHADKNDLDAYIQSIDGLKKLYLVHGEEVGMHALAERTIAAKPIEVILPQREAEYVIV